MSFARLPPKIIAEIGTPCGSSHSREIEGHWDAGVVKRLLGCAPFSPEAGVQGLPLQSIPSEGVSSSPSHQTVLSFFATTLVNIVFFWIVMSALGFDLLLVPGATPKNPDSGLIAQSLPSGPMRSHA